MKFQNILIIGLFTFLLQACEREEVELTNTNTVVVEAYLIAGQMIDSLLITQSFSYAQEQEEIITLDELEVTISDFTNTYNLSSAGNGIYQHSDLLIQPDQSYRLEFSWEGNLISAETYVPPLTEATLSADEIQLEKVELGTFGGPGDMPDPIDITWINTTGDYYYVTITNLEDDPEYVNENQAELEDADGGRRRFEFISEPEISNFYSINPRRDLSQYGRHEIVVFRVNPEYAALYQSSGNSTLSLELPPTNIENGLGIFTGVSSDTLYLEVEEI